MKKILAITIGLIVSATVCAEPIKSRVASFETAYIEPDDLPYAAELQWVSGIDAQTYVSTTLKPEATHVIKWKASLAVTTVSWARIGFDTYINDQTEFTGIRKWGAGNTEQASYFRSGPMGSMLRKVDCTIDHEYVLYRNDVGVRMIVTIVDGVVQTQYMDVCGLSDYRAPYQKIGKYSKIWYFIVEENGEVLIHLKPVLDFDGVACMYDVVSGELLYPENGEFIAGPELGGE
jgi:hypothetical protein